jgi:hypothetical protein
MLRIAAGNDVSVRSLCAWLGNDDQIWTLDSMADSNPLINSIAVAVGVEKETVIQCLRPSLYRTVRETRCSNNPLKGCSR